MIVRFLKGAAGAVGEYTADPQIKGSSWGWWGASRRFYLNPKSW